VAGEVLGFWDGIVLPVFCWPVLASDRFIGGVLSRFPTTASNCALSTGGWVCAVGDGGGERGGRVCGGSAGAVGEDGVEARQDGGSDSDGG
jgi:hypothetical protein